MTTRTSADGEVGIDWTGFARVLAALVVLGAGLWAAGRLTYLYVVDDVVGGRHLDDPSAVRLPAFVAGVVVVIGVTVLIQVLRHRLTGAAGAAALVTITVVSVLAAALAVGSFPGIVRAVVTAVDTDGRTPLWSTTVPLTVVSGVSDASEDRVTVTGAFNDHGCEERALEVTLDRRTGEVLLVVRDPVSRYGVPPAPTEQLLEDGLRVEQGEVPFTCSH